MVTLVCLIGIVYTKDMKICGLNKTTLLDYPSHVAATIFTCGCNFRCPFCHNRDLVTGGSSVSEIPHQEILAFLKKRTGILSGVCITGGEPTLHASLPSFIKTIKDLGYCVKLDTNGSNPAMLRSLLDQKLLDYIAMDIKSDREHYAQAAGVDSPDLDAVNASIELIRSCGIPYEFRTTVVKELHDADILANIAVWLDGSMAYYLQNYRENENVLQPGFTSFTRQQLEDFLSLFDNHFQCTGIRGV